MAARRVVLLLLVVLVASTLAAALIPTPQRSGTPDETERTTTKRDRPDPEKRRGRLVVATFEAQGDPQTIHLREGDELRMEIGSRTVEQIEIAAFGLIEDASRDAPARFDLLADRRGTFPIRLVDPRREIGRLVVR